MKPPLSPRHVEETVNLTTRLKQQHHREATPFQRAVRKLTNTIGEPFFLGVLTLTISGWIAWNLFSDVVGIEPFDPWPFHILIGVIGVISFYCVLLVLICERHDEQLELNREQLILELVLASEQKTAKTIEILMQMRHDAPTLNERIDPEADAMAKPANPAEVLGTIRDMRGASKTELSSTKAT